MTKLEMQIALQSLFKKMMGEWQFGDRVYSLTKNIIGYYSSTVDCKGARICFFNTSLGHLTTEDDLIRLPLPIDPVNSSRGLWGMVDWDRWILSTAIDKTKVYIRSADCDIEAAPETALLKALLAQYDWICEDCPVVKEK
jgi:hypothetical protein